jgi:hypothetical protein
LRVGALDGAGLRSIKVILTWAPSDQTFSKHGVVAPTSLQLACGLDGRCRSHDERQGGDGCGGDADKN